MIIREIFLDIVQQQERILIIPKATRVKQVAQRKHNAAHCSRNRRLPAMLFISDARVSII